MKQQIEKPSRPWLVLAITSFAVFASALDTTILYVAFPSIQKTFSEVSRADLSWAINAYTIVFAAPSRPRRPTGGILRRRSYFHGCVSVRRGGSKRRVADRRARHSGGRCGGPSSLVAGRRAWGVSAGEAGNRRRHLGSRWRACRGGRPDTGRPDHRCGKLAAGLLPEPANRCAHDLSRLALHP